MLSMSCPGLLLLSSKLLMILWQLSLEGPVGVGDVVDGVQDAAELLNHFLWESWQDQVEAQPVVGDAATVEG